MTLRAREVRRALCQESRSVWKKFDWCVRMHRMLSDVPITALMLKTIRVYSKTTLNRRSSCSSSLTNGGYFNKITYHGTLSVLPSIRSTRITSRFFPDHREVLVWIRSNTFGLSLTGASTAPSTINGWTGGTRSTNLKSALAGRIYARPPPEVHQSKR